MCYQVTCSECKKPTWGGCGKHIDGVFTNFKYEDRCACKARTQEEQNKNAPGGGGKHDKSLLPGYFACNQLDSQFK